LPPAQKVVVLFALSFLEGGYNNPKILKLISRGWRFGGIIAFYYYY